MVQLGIPRASRREYAAPSPRSSVSRRRRRGARSGHSGTFGESCEQRSRAEQRSPQDNPEWRSSDPSALRNPNSVALYAVLHQRVKCVARRNSHGYPKSLRNLLFDLHEAKHVRNFRRWVVVNEEIEVAVGSFSPNGPGAEYEKTRRAVLAQSGVVGPQDLDQSGSVHRFNIATIGVARRDTLGRRNRRADRQGCRQCSTTCDHSSTSVNCSRMVRWMAEKLSSEISVSTVSPAGVRCTDSPSMLSIS